MCRQTRTMCFWIFLLILTTPALSLRLLYANEKDIRIIWTQQDKEKIILSRAEEAVAIDVIIAKNLLFWSDVSEKKIFSCSIKLKSCIPKVIMSHENGHIEGLAVDWLTEKLYWTDSVVKQIIVSTIEGHHRKALIWNNIDLPRAIALDPNTKFMFWTDWGEIPRISRAGMDGSNHIDLVRHLITWPNSLTLDYSKKRVYWIDARHNCIANVDYSGRDRHLTYSKATNHPYAITMFGNQLFWTDWDSNSIRTCNTSKNNATTSVKTVRSGLFSPMDIKVYEPQRQYEGLYNPCENKNGGCSQLCLLSPQRNFSCSCTSGVALKSDSKTCEDGPQAFLLLSRLNQIRIISLSTDEHSDVQVPIANTGHVVGIEFDPLTKMLYWIDSHNREIRCAPLNGSKDVSVIIKGRNDSLIEGIAVDWINKHLYWTDTGTDMIEVSYLNGSKRMSIVQGNLDEPRSIAVDHKERFVYWSDWGVFPKIEKAKLDGKRREIIINTSIAWPNSIVIDHKLRKLYWADAKLDKIESWDMRSGNRVIITQERVPHIYALTLVGDNLYWTDLQSKVLATVNKEQTINRTVIMNFLPNGLALKGVDLREVQNRGS